jgi:hypothetical protein
MMATESKCLKKGSRIIGEAMPLLKVGNPTFVAPYASLLRPMPLQPS